MTRWHERPEGGGFVAMWMMVNLARGVGRGAVRLLLYPITLYFFVRRGPERRASRAYLGRALGRPARALDVMRHLHCFASTILDRVFLLSEQFNSFRIESTGLVELHEQIDRGKGLLMLGSHLGSFDALRALSRQRPDVSVRVVLDVGHNAALTQLLGALNPTLAANVIDARMDGTSVVLAIKEALDQGAVVTLLADRAAPGETTVPAHVLGTEARLPASPWLIAAALKVPVVLCFGLYRGGNRYDLKFEVFAESLALERRGREQALAAVVQRYADRLSAHARLAPYNWFNFYDFWQTPARAGPDADAASASAAGVAAGARGEA
ncbi:MAG TPA: acyltransferase [Candidatus Saccharimonadia bacterium]|nr:acyltransferase [Candidatus Saccharimonadia bacterium]